MRREYDNIQILISYKENLDILIESGNFVEALKKATSLLEKCEMDFEVLIKKKDLLFLTNDLKSANQLVRNREVFLQMKSSSKLVVIKALLDRHANKIGTLKSR